MPTSKKSKKEEPIEEFKVKVSLNDGLNIKYGSHLIIPVYGELAAQNGTQSTLKALYKKHGKKYIHFNLTPACEYQKQHKWPEEPFLNVNVLGSTETTKENWLGYIMPVTPEEDDDEIRLERKKYVEKIIKIGHLCSLSITGKIIKEGKEYSMLLFASRENIDLIMKELPRLKREQAIENENKLKRKKRNRIILFSVLAIVALLCIIFPQAALQVFCFIIGLIVIALFF